MFGLDDWIASLSDGASVGVVLLVAVLLGLRHATDPDHIAAMTTLVASRRERVARSAAELGAWWGIGHAITLVVFGIPILLAERYLPEGLQRGAETAVAALIVFLAAPAARALASRLLRLPCASASGAGAPACRPHARAARSASGSSTAWAAARASASSCSRRSRPRRSPSPRSSCSRLFTAVSMTIVTVGFGLTLSGATVAAASATLVPVLGAVSLAFGLWYAAAAWALAPYPF